MSGDKDIRGEQLFIQPPKVVDITNPTYQSIQGRYFVGQSGPISEEVGFHAWVMLRNPEDSGVNLFLSAVTLSNFSADPYAAYYYFNALPMQEGLISEQISPANLALDPPPAHQAEILWAGRISGSPDGGTLVFTRAVSGYTTEKTDYDGRLIFGPGDWLFIELNTIRPASSLFGRVAFGWWEEEVDRL